MARITKILIVPKQQNQSWRTSDEIEKGKEVREGRSPPKH